MMKEVLRIATRKSPLALWQANHVAKLLKNHYPLLKIEFLELVTKGDQLINLPLYEVGGKALFLKELEQSLLDNKADIAVHSMKDVPNELPEGLVLDIILERGNPFDTLISKGDLILNELPANSVIGTSSLRRQGQIQRQRPDIIVKSLRGNVGTRLEKLDKQEYDAIVLAKAGLERLNLDSRITQTFSMEQCLPAIGQGAIGLEARKDLELAKLLQPLCHEDTKYCVLAERAFNCALGGTCHSPIAGFAQLQGDLLELQGAVFTVDGQQCLLDKELGAKQQAQQIGKKLAERLIVAGAFKLLGLSKKK